MCKHAQQRREEDESVGYSQILTNDFLLIQMYVKVAVIVVFNQIVSLLRQSKLNLGGSEKLINQIVIRTLVA